MNTLLFNRTKLILAVAAILVAWPLPKIVAQTADIPSGTGSIEVLRSELKLDRKVVIAESMQFTETENAAFWPLYGEYRAAMDKLGDGLVELVLEYADVYPNVPEDRAQKMLRDYTALEKKLPDTRAWYLKKFAKILPVSKVLRLAQLENRFDLALRLQLASAIPLAPIEGRLTGSAAMVTATVQGVAGGAAVQIYELAAKVIAVDPATRTLTLLGSDDIKQIVKVGPEAVNFDQIQVGDRLKLKVARQLVVFVAGKDEAPGDGGSRLVALAPEGAKPGGIMAEARQATATVIAIDGSHRQATLQFADGTTRIVAVRPDVDLSKHQVGDQVVIRLTEALALQVEKQ